MSPLAVGMASIFALGFCFTSWSEPVCAMSPAQNLDDVPITDPQAGAFYRSQTRIGLIQDTSFLIPSDWQGSLPPGSRTFYLESPKHPGVGLVAIIQEATPEELEDHLNEPQVIDEGYVLQPIGSATRTRERITATYQSGENTGRAIAIFGPSRMGILFLFTGPKEHAAYYDRVLEEIAASARFSRTEQRLPERQNGM